MRVLCTGGAGVIGSTITRRLAEAGHVVDVIDAMEAPRNAWIAERLPAASILKARLEQFSAEALADLLSDVDAVIHAAASTGIPHSVLHPDDDWRSNVDATRVLLEALRLQPRPTVVLSSVKPYRVPVYRESWGGLTEDCPLYSDEPYAASKASQVHLCTSYAASYGVPVVAFRCSNLASCAPPHGPRHGAWTWLAICAAIGRPMEIQGDGLQSRDVLAGDDVFTACVAAIENIGRFRGEVFNIGGGSSNRITIADAVALLREWQPSAEVRYAPPRAMDDKHVFASYTKFNRATGWRPQVQVRDLLRQIFDWACANREDLRKLYEGA